MKIQDIIFLFILVFLVWKRNDKWSIVFGLTSILLAIPLFVKWIFFTAERLTWYAAAFFLLAIIQGLHKRNP